MKILHLTLKKKWFDMVSDPNPETRKDEEYRQIKIYWLKRFLKTPTQHMPDIINKDNHIQFDAVKFTHGYSKNAPTITRVWKGLEVGTAIPHWSDNWQGDVFKIKLGEITNP